LTDRYSRFGFACPRRFARLKNRHKSNKSKMKEILRTLFLTLSEQLKVK